jgi:hypothetical protein
MPSTRSARNGTVMSSSPQRRQLLKIAVILIVCFVGAAGAVEREGVDGMPRHDPSSVLRESSQPPAATTPCPGSEARAFDFWIGEWEITQKILREDGSWLELPARTSVTASLDGCALIEHWQGEVLFFWEGMERPETMKGLSVRAHDPESGAWNIHWMDTRSPRFGSPYVGTFAAGRGEFFREWKTPQGPRVGRITFSEMRKHTVNWALAISTDGRRTWQTMWTMAMRRAPAGNDR